MSVGGSTRPVVPVAAAVAVVASIELGKPIPFAQTCKKNSEDGVRKSGTTTCAHDGANAR